MKKKSWKLLQSVRASLSSCCRYGAGSLGGYTLVEMVVTFAVFSLAFGAIAAIFLGFATAQARTSQAQRLLNEAHYLFESIAREIRINAVDYACPGVPYATVYSYICLKAPDGRSVHLRVQNVSGVLQVQVCREYGTPACTGAGDWSVLNPSFVKINNFAFRVYPTNDPSESVSQIDIYHPTTMIFANVEAGVGRGRQDYEFQTAVASRVYSF